MYHYFLNHKERAFDAFKIYKVEVERQKERKIKIVRSYKGGEYYGDIQKKMPSPFVKFLER